MEDMARLAVVEQTLSSGVKFQRLLFELRQCINQILENPHDNKLRTIKSDVLEGLFDNASFVDYLKYVGFRKNGPELLYPSEQTLNNLRVAQAAIERKICFCYGALKEHPSLKTSKSPRRMFTHANILKTNKQLLVKIQRLFNDVLVYEDEDLLQLARDEMPLIKLQLVALDRVRESQKLIKAGRQDSLDLPFDKALLMELMCWFKEKYFLWFDEPSCEKCGIRMIFSETVTVTMDGETCNMEKFRCHCGMVSVFPRYNDPRNLLRSRRGRCGEWANCFALMCRALGYDTRYVYDTTDHVWCEIFDYETNSWIHVDPCEATLDAPLLYSQGWGKKLSYIIAVSRDDIQDVTWRYTMDHKQVLNRRKLCTEKELLDTILALRDHRQRQVSEPRRRYLAKRNLMELVSLMIEKKPSDYETHGRISGSVEWRSGRGEMGTHPSRSFDFPIAGTYIISYCTASDVYRIQDTYGQIETIKPWSACVYQVENVFRKVEHDWKQVYLARNEGAEHGSVAWRVCAGAGLRLDKLRVSVLAQLYDTGRMDWTLQYDDQPPEDANFTVESLKRGVTLSRACRSLVLRVRLRGGRGGAAWQHAQLFRLPLSDILLPAFVLKAVITKSE